METTNSNGNNETERLMRDEGSKSRKLQSRVFAIGLILAIVSFAEFYYGNVLQTQIGDYEKNVDELELLREDIIEIEHKYLDVWYNLLKTDLYVDLAVKNLILTTEQAEDYILREVFSIFQVWNIFKDKFVDIRYYYNYEWLFTEDVFVLYYNYYDNYRAYINGLFFYTDELPSHEVLENWTIATVSEINYTYSNTYDILVREVYDRPMLLRVDMAKFDEYVNENCLNPLNEAHSTLLALQISTNANTVGILILGFITSFDDASKKWKAMYVLLSIVSILSSSLITYVVFISPVFV